MDCQVDCMFTDESVKTKSGTRRRRTTRTRTRTRTRTKTIIIIIIIIRRRRVKTTKSQPPKSVYQHFECPSCLGSGNDYHHGTLTGKFGRHEVATGYKVGHLGHLEGEQPQIGDLLTMVINLLKLNGMILQVLVINGVVTPINGP